jgi:hypothetical protein
MTINLTQQESENLFFDAMCNGLNELRYYDLDLDYDDEEYKASKRKVIIEKESESICFEEVLMQMLIDGYKLTIIDSNDDESHYITLDMVHERVALTPIRHLMDAINERGDATTADCILQTVIYKDVIYG